jgi:branched-chain amino acid transport system substrate-binding protein
VALLGAVSVASAQTIRIGFSTPTTGPAALASEWEKWGVEAALEEINAAGGLLGRKVEIVAVDNRCNPTEGANSARRLIQDKVVAIIGGHCSSATLAMMPIIKDAKVPMVTAISSSPQIATMSGAGGNEFMFRINPDDLMMAQALTEYLGAKKLFRNVAILAEDSDFGRGGAQAFTPLAQKAGMSIISTDFSPQSTPDFTPILTRIASKKPDAIAIFMLGADQLSMLRSAMQLGLKIPYTGRAELAGKNIELIQQGAMEGSVSAWTYSPDVDNPANKAFAAKIVNKHKTTATLQAWGGYDSMRVIAQAINEAGSAEPEKIRDAMTKVKFTSLLGKPVSFDKNNQGGKVVVLQSVKDKKVVILDLYELKQ